MMGILFVNEDYQIDVYVYLYYNIEFNCVVFRCFIISVNNLVYKYIFIYLLYKFVLDII